MTKSSPNTIDILSVIDCEQIFKNGMKGGTPEKPTYLGSFGKSDHYVHMVTSSVYADPSGKQGTSVSTGEGQSELRVKANVGDTIQWSITCLHEGVQYSVTLQAMDKLNGAKDISDASAVPLSIKRVSSAPAPAKPEIFSFTKNVLRATLLKNGDVTYRLSFQVFDKDGTSLGFFQWDPFIRVELGV